MISGRVHTTSKRFRIRKRPGHQSLSGCLDRNNLPLLISSMLNIKSPKCPSDINKQAIRCYMKSRTNSPATPETEVVPGVNVGDCGVFGG
jgi:hypothetical protein